MFADHGGADADVGAASLIMKEIMKTGNYSEVLERIGAALNETKAIFARFTPGEIAAEYKAGHDPVTAADRELDVALRKHLLREGEGWLSEESADDRSRLRYERVWVVDPLDGTREFVEGIPEFCASIALVERGAPVAGGIYNPATDELFLGSVRSGMTYQGAPRHSSRHNTLTDATILASRSEIKRGEWKKFERAPFRVQPMGSVAYKLARVSAGLADITFTLTPKHEWDVAGGAALVLSGGGFVETLDGPLVSNQRDPLISGLIAGGPLLKDGLVEFLAPFTQAVARK
jgi:myo-inositol-1(or 4)-monophosphatase